jgi:oligopeptidase A
MLADRWFSALRCAPNAIPQSMSEGPSKTNPLLHITLEPPYAHVTAAHITEAVPQLIERAQRRIDAICAIAHDERTWDNTLVALDECSRELEWAMAIVSHLEAVMNTPDIRAAYNAMQPLVSAFYAQIPLHAALWTAVKEYSLSDQARGLTGVRARYLRKTVDGFRRQGADLAGPQKERLQAIAERLSALTTAFSQNVLDSHAAFERPVTDVSELEGLPPSALSMAKQAAASKGRDGWMLTLQSPIYLAVMTYADSAALREELWRAYSTSATVAPHDNREHLREILQLRREQAALLGFVDFADYILADRMAKTGANAQRFVDDLDARTRPFFERERLELQSFRAELLGPTAGPMQPWDVAYFAEKLRRARFAFDEETLRPYFAVSSVMEGMFTIAERVFGIRVQKRSEGGYHPSVTNYVISEPDGRELCHFCVDLYPREGKRDGAWMSGVLSALPGEGPQVGLFCANVTPPTAEQPALMTFREVETLFHEFGHLLHHALSRVEIRGMVGTKVAWDFVELPSQIMENWCMQREALDLFARHFQTQQPVDAELFEKMKRARTFRAASMQMRQLSFAAVDLALHRAYDTQGPASPVQFARGLMERFSATPLPDSYAMIASFNHLFADPVGYAAAYYSYKWAEVLDADAFTRFESEGIFNERTGKDFRDTVLSRGDSEDPAELFRSFMGRPPSVDALLRRNGLLAQST